MRGLCLEPAVRVLDLEGSVQQVESKPFGHRAKRAYCDQPEVVVNALGQVRRDGADNLDVGRRQLAQIVEVEQCERRIDESLHGSQSRLFVDGGSWEHVPGADHVPWMDEGDGRLAPVPDAHVDPREALVEQEGTRRSWPECHRSGPKVNSLRALEHLALFCGAQERE